MRTPSKSTLPIEPLGTALGTARGVALKGRDKGLELLDSDAAQELLRKGQHVAIVARDRGVELLESDTAQEIVRRGKGVVSAAKGELIERPTKKSRKPLKMMLFIVGSAAGVAAAVVSKRMNTPLPDSGIPTYDDPAAQFPKKDGVIDLTSVAAEEGVTTAPTAGTTAGTAVGPATKMTSSTAPSTGATSPTTGTTPSTPTPSAPTTTSAKTSPPKSTGAPKTTSPSTAATGASNGSTTRPTTP